MTRSSRGSEGWCPTTKQAAHQMVLKQPLHRRGWKHQDLLQDPNKRMEGRILMTLLATDIATGWSECPPLLSQDGI